MQRGLLRPSQMEATSGIWTAPSTQVVPPTLAGHNEDNSTLDDQGLLSPYLARTSNRRSSSLMAKDVHTIDLDTWWKQLVHQPLGLKSKGLRLSLDDAVTQSLIHAPQVLIAASEPEIRETAVVEEASRFDWNLFWETKYDSLNDPIGNTLTTGNNESRFRQQEWYSRGGMRRRQLNGSELELSQRLGYLDNNSRFLLPPDQGSARLELNYRQPIGRGAGTYVNQSVVLLAKINQRTAYDELKLQMQSQLADVTEAYWRLYLTRSELLLRLRLFDRADRIFKQLQGRAEVDAIDRQIFRAEAAVANRRAEIARAVTSVKNAESQLRLLINEPNLMQHGNAELLPLESPALTMQSIEMADALATALIFRPDIASALRDLRATNVQLGVGKNELLPKLDFLVGSYVAGLDADSDFTNSWLNQFKDGGPGYNVGLEFEMPIGNRAALSRQRRRQLQLAQSMQKFKLVVETALNEVEVAVREVETTNQELVGRRRSMTAAQKEHDYLVDRWVTLPGIDDSVTQLLENLLDSQERLANEEADFAKAQFAHSMAGIRVRQAMGTLMQISSK
ncbi:MAG: TolC family protein [Planctomycetota bacterium]